MKAPNSCRVCEVPEKRTVEQGLRVGNSPRNLARLFSGLTRLQITRHRDGCMQLKSLEKGNEHA